MITGSEIKICSQKLLPHHQRELNDIHSSGKSPEHVEKLQAAFFIKKLWTEGSHIIIGFLESPDRIQRNNISGSKNLDPLQNEVNGIPIKEAIQKIVSERIIPLVNLNISFTDNISDANVRVSFDPSGGAWSLVGTDHLQQKDGATMNLGWFDVPTTIHEFGHVLGMIHEHQNPSGKKIMWDKKKVFEWAKETQGWSEETTKENIIDKYDKKSINGSNFDPLSIMLYFFPPNLTTNNKGTKQNFRLSGEDILWIHNTYPKNDGISPSEFYKKTYGVNLEDSISKSNKLSLNFASDNKKSFNWKNILIFIIIIFVLLLIITLIWKIFRS